MEAQLQEMQKQMTAMNEKMNLIMSLFIGLNTEKLDGMSLDEIKTETATLKEKNDAIENDDNYVLEVKEEKEEISKGSQATDIIHKILMKEALSPEDEAFYKENIVIMKMMWDMQNLNEEDMVNRIKVEQVLIEEISEDDEEEEFNENSN